MQDNFLSPYWVWESELPEQICNYIIKLSEKNKYTQGIAGNNTLSDKRNRNVNVQFIKNCTWINTMLYGYVAYANSINFNYDISDRDSESMQISRYEVGQFYNKHTDFSPYRDHSAHLRKLSLSLQLSSEDEYDGGELILDLPGDYEEYIFSKKKGSIIVFDSRVTHRVTEVTKGVRYSLVKWVQGNSPLR